MMSETDQRKIDPETCDRLRELSALGFLASELRDMLDRNGLNVNHKNVQKHLKGECGCGNTVPAVSYNGSMWQFVEEDNE